MLFGQRSRFAIEIGDIDRHEGYPGLFVQFRMWIDDVPIGDWEDRIVLGVSMTRARTLRENEQSRSNMPFPLVSAEEVFKTAYDDYYSLEPYDPNEMCNRHPTFCDRFHMEHVGDNAITDHYGMVLVASTDGTQRVIVRQFDLSRDRTKGPIIVDVTLPHGCVELALGTYIEWALSQLATAH